MVHNNKYIYSTVPGYQKALKRRNGVPRPNGFCEAHNVQFYAVLSQTLKCCELSVIDAQIFYEIKALLVVLASLEHSVRGPASL